MGDFISGIGQASKLNENIGQCEEVTKNKNGEETLQFRKHNDIYEDVERQTKQKRQSQNGLYSAYEREKATSLTL